jgi:hypothetical protein
MHLLMELPDHIAHKMYKETLNRLDELARSVREGKHVLEAKDFCSWLQFSGYCMALDLCSNTHKFLPVDGKAVRRKIDDLIYDCGEWLKSGKVIPKYAESDIAEINSKLDQLQKTISEVAAEKEKNAARSLESCVLNLPPQSSPRDN